jgi:hypothetical protein
MAKEVEYSKDVGRTNEKKRDRENKNYYSNHTVEEKRHAYDGKYSDEKKNSFRRKHSNERDTSHDRKYLYEKKNSQKRSDSCEEKTSHERRRSYHKRHSYDSSVSYDRKDSYKRQESRDKRRVDRKRYSSEEKDFHRKRYFCDKDRSSDTVASRNGRRSCGEKRSRSRRHLHVRYSSHSSRLSSVEKPSVEKVHRKQQNSSYDKRTNLYDTSSSDGENHTYFRGDHTKKQSLNKVTLSSKKSSQEKSDGIDVNYFSKEKKLKQSSCDEKKRDCKGEDEKIDNKLNYTSNSLEEINDTEKNRRYKTNEPSSPSVNRGLSPKKEHSTDSTARLYTKHTDSYKDPQKEFLDGKPESKSCENGRKSEKKSAQLNTNVCNNSIVQDRGDALYQDVEKNFDSLTQDGNLKDKGETYAKGNRNAINFIVMNFRLSNEFYRVSDVNKPSDNNLCRFLQ